MAARAFSTAKAYLKLRFGNDSALEDVNGVNMYGVWLNEALSWITVRDRFWEYKLNFHFPQLEDIDATMTTTDGTAYVSLPTGTYIVREAFDYTSNNPLNWVDPKKYLRYPDRADTNAESAPLEWTHIGSSLYFHPTPDDEYTIEILRRIYATAMSDDDDTSGLGEEWDFGILNLAAHIGHTWVGEDDKADRAKGAFLDHVSGVFGIYYKEHKAGHNIMGMNPAAKNYDFN